VPRWQVLGILVGFPLIYLINGVLPWSYGLFVQGDRSWYVPFWISILVLHWISLALTVAVVYRAGGTLADLGLRLSTAKAVAMVATFVSCGAVLLWLRSLWPAAESPPEDWQMMYPATPVEKVVMLFGACTAGVCEELIYRGFAIRTLQARGFSTWLAILVAGISFSLIHGIAGVILLPAYLIVATVFSLLFLWRGDLFPVIMLHAVFDMLMVLAI
jgi:membrane protease YdiL (CAAX protease family)